MSPCGSHLSAGSSSRSSSLGNPHTRCAQKQGLPTPQRINGDQGFCLHLQNCRCELFWVKEVANFISKLASEVKIFFLFSNECCCQEGVCCHSYFIENIKKLLSILMEKKKKITKLKPDAVTVPFVFM